MAARKTAKKIFSWRNTALVVAAAAAAGCSSGGDTVERQARSTPTPSPSNSSTTEELTPTPIASLSPTPSPSPSVTPTQLPSPTPTGPAHLFPAPTFIQPLEDLPPLTGGDAVAACGGTSVFGPIAGDMRINAGIEPQTTDGVPFDGQSAAFRVEVLSQSIPRENMRSLDVGGTGVAAGLFPSRTIGFSKPEVEAATANFATGKASYATAMEAEFPVPGSRNGEFGLSVSVTYLDRSGSLQEASAAMAGDILHTDAGLQATIESDFDTDSRMYAKDQDLC